MQQPSYLPQVKEQYEHYPYPPRRPEDERRILRASITECLDALNHFGFGGRRNFYKNFRVLSAGGGTGDGTIFLAEQLRDTDAEIVYLDMSSASMEVAKARAAVRGLTNIQWVQASLLDVGSLDLGKFDYINCSGVLHHLESPEAGLKALERVLAPGGVMGIMLYGKYGRTAIYQMQKLLRLIAGNESDTDRLATCKTVLGNLPPTNWFMHSKEWFYDLKNGDAAIYDLLLHSQDRAYSIPELYDYIEGAGLRIAEFLGPNPYAPAQYIRDKQLLARVQAMDLKSQYAIGELLGGMVKGHTFYAAREVIAPPTSDDLDMIPSLPVNTSPDLYEQLYNLVKASPKGVAFKTEFRTVQVPPHPSMATVIKCMDGKRSLKEIFAKATTFGNVKRADVMEAFDVLYNALAPAQMLFLRHKDVPHYLTTKEMQQRMEARIGGP